jgi:hypothetical protein
MLCTCLTRPLCKAFTAQERMQDFPALSSFRQGFKCFRRFRLNQLARNLLPDGFSLSCMPVDSIPIQNPGPRLLNVLAHGFLCQNPIART